MDSKPSSLEDIYGEMPLSEASFYAIIDESGPIRTPEMLVDLSAALGLMADSLIVDAGCGQGRHAVAFATRNGCRIVALDPVQRNIRATAEACQAAGLTTRALVAAGRIEMMPLPDAGVDLILARDMLNHMPDLSAALSECRRVLRPGGHMLIFTVFATDRLRPDEARELFPPLAVVPETTSRVLFEATANEAGLAIVESDVVGSQWREWGERDGQGRTSAQLLRVARLRRRKAAIVAQIGQKLYDIELADCLWGVYQMLGKLEPVVYLLRASDPDRNANTDQIQLPAI